MKLILIIPFLVLTSSFAQSITKQPEEKEELYPVQNVKEPSIQDTTKLPFGSGYSRQQGSGPGNGEMVPDRPSRIRLNDPLIGHIEVEQDAVIFLKLMIDEKGNVVSCVTTSKTTTTDAQLIKQVILAAKQVKFNPEPGASLEPYYLTVRFKRSN